MTAEEISEKLARAEAMVEAIESAIEGGVGQASFSLFGRSYAYRSMEELLSAHRYWERKVAALREAQRRNEGKPSRSTAWARFA